MVIVQWACGILIILGSCALKGDAALYKSAPLVSAAVTLIQNTAWFFLPILTAIAGIAHHAQNRIGGHSIWGPTHWLVDEFRRLIFEGSSGPTHYHRVTIYKRTKRIKVWDRSGPPLRWHLLGIRRSDWLVPVEASADSTLRSLPTLWSPDDADRAEGVAGVAWARAVMLYVEGLPQIEEGSSEDDLLEYARVARLRPEWLKIKLKEQSIQWPRAFCALPLEFDGKRWGVIVIDTRNEVLPNHDRIETSYRRFAQLFAILLAEH